MTLILPPNATKEEKHLVEAINYQTNAELIKGFKLGEPPDQFLSWLIWEYGLGEVLRWLPDSRKAIREGVQWQRIRGTPESLRIALSWANLEGISVEEEVPGEHFAEFQVGITGDVPNDLFIDAVIELARLSSPIRTRLTRMYNDAYDIRRFILDQSDWGAFLSDYSGNRLTQEGPILSFGRGNSFNAFAPAVKLIHAHDHNLHTNAVLLDVYRLDQVLLGISASHVINHQSGYGRIYSAGNEVGVFSPHGEIEPHLRFAKAQVVLSDNWVLGNINSCFPVNRIEETGQTFILDDEAKLSEIIWRLTPVPLNERFKSYHNAGNSEVFNDQVIAGSKHYEFITRYDEHIIWPHLSDRKHSVPSSKPIIIKSAIGEGSYLGVDDWHDHRHLDRPWNNTKNIVDNIIDRFLSGEPEPFTDQITYDAISHVEAFYEVDRGGDNAVNKPIILKDIIGKGNYLGADGWHGYQHLDRPWNNTDNVIDKIVEKFRKGKFVEIDGQAVHSSKGCSEYFTTALVDNAIGTSTKPILEKDITSNPLYPGVGGAANHIDAESWTRFLISKSEQFTEQEIHCAVTLSEYTAAAIIDSVTSDESPIMLRDLLQESEYLGVDGWHDHKHLNRPWNDADNVIGRTTNRQWLNGYPEPFDDQTINGVTGDSKHYANVLGSDGVTETPIIEKEFLGCESAYTFMDGWHGYQHLNQPWNAMPPNIETVHSQEMQ